MTRPLTDPEALIAALAEEARSAAPSGQPGPEPEELLDYLAGRLSPEDEERVGRQLVASPEAADALLDLADLEAAGAAAGAQPTELAARAGWKDLKERLPGAVPWFRRLPPLLSSVAAVLLLTTVGLGVREARDQSELSRLQSELSRPVANIPTRELVSDSRAAGEETIELPASGRVRLVLRPAERCSHYDAVVEGPGGRDHQKVPGLDPDERGNLNLTLPVEPGGYGLRLFGCQPRHELEAHRFQVLPHGG